MNTIQSTSDHLPTQSHHEHRTMDVTSAGNIHPRRLCLDCHIEFEDRPAERRRDWLSDIS